MSSPPTQHAARGWLASRVARIIAGPLLLLAVLAGFLAWQVERLLDLMGWVEHASQVIAQSNVLARLVVAQESSLRGYLLTQDRALLDGFDRRRAEIGPVIEALAASEAHDRASVLVIEALSSEYAAWERSASAAIQARAQPGWALNLAEVQRRVQGMERMRAALEGFLAREEAQRSAHIASVATQTRRTIVTGAATFFVLAGGLALVSRRRIEETDAIFRRASDAESRLCRIWDSNIIGVLYADDRGNILEANDALLGMVGFTREDLAAGRVRWTDMTPPEHTAADARGLAEARERGACTPYEKVYIGKHGRRVPVLLGYAELQGDRAQYIAFAQDLTEIRRAEDRLRESEARFRTMVDALPALAWTTKPDGHVDWLNQALLDYTGCEPSELAGWSWQGIHDPALLPTVLSTWAACVASAQPFEMELPLRGKDGRFRRFLMRVRPFEDAQGRVAQWFGTATDVTELVEAREAATRSHDRLRRLADASLEVIRAADLEAMLQATAEAARALTGARLATCGHGLGHARLAAGSSATTPDAPRCPAGEPYQYEKGGVRDDLLEGAQALRLTHAELEAHPRWWGVPARHVPMRGLLGVPMVDGVGRRGHSVLLVTDKAEGDFTSEDESLLRQLATVASLALEHVMARASLEDAARRKDQFLAMLSHELRNPLAPIQSSLHILDRVPAGSSEALRAQAVIGRQIGHLTRLVDDLLDVTRIARGKIRLQREPLDLVEVVRRCADDHRAAFGASHTTLDLALPALPLRVLGDRTRLTQVVGNLLQNAAKFTPAGGHVTVSVEHDEASTEAIVRVRDDGAGIAPDMLARIFEPFTQADVTLDRSKGGLGLGLSLAKGLVEMHGGAVSAASEGLGKGAELTVRLPLLTAPHVAVPARPAPRPPAGLRVLVIDDNIDGAESIREVLALEGHDVEVAFSGVEGLEKAMSHAPDVVLCDIGLPGMNGYEVARAIRAAPPRRVPRLVALTGYAGPDDVARSLEAGFDAHLAKPPTVEKLQAALAPARGMGG